jgi:formylglycine-generating enzyme required for sulfatase activity
MSAHHSTFVSHAHADNELCDRYVNALRARGIDVWYDRNNAQSGHFLGEQIQQELAARPAFVLLMTEASLNSFWVRLERESYLGLMAHDPSRILVAVRIAPCQPPPMVNAFLWIDALSMPFDQAIDEIARALLTQGASTPTSPSAPPLGVASTPSRPAAPANALVARLLPQIRDAYNAQDWSQVARLSDYLQQNTKAGEIPTEVYQMRGRALRAERDYAGAKAAWDVAHTRDPLDVAALRAAAEARIALNIPAELDAALPLLKNAITFTNDRGQRLELLRVSAHVLTTLAHRETGAAAQARWNELLRTANEALRLAGENDANWLAVKLEALRGLGQTPEALEVARRLTARPDATAAHWLTRARLAWQVAGESPTDEARQSLDAASRLAPQDSEIATARHELLAILTPDRFPPRLAQLGFTANKRNGVAFITPPVCQVPAGEFLMGSDPRRDKGTYTDGTEQPQHRVNLAAYAIARFPVTVAEYACFVEGANHRQPQQWANQLQMLDHPVVYVSWNDAVAYAAWLANLTQQPWRLPTEAEWEKAARWEARSGVARLYPWGDTFDASRANTDEGGKGGTTAVGSYPNGASPYGAEEMAGNVWEWTHSLYKPYPYTESDGREVGNSTENRVLRGGSWIINSQGARAACRSQNGPVDLYSIGGFRLVLAAPGSAIH